MLNCIDMDGQGNGYDVALIEAVQSAVSIPVIASSGAGKAKHFVNVFQLTEVNAALAAGIFHRNEVSIQEVKVSLKMANIPFRANKTF
jgi:glutamine amidotransferase/cyclase